MATSATLGGKDDTQKVLEVIRTQLWDAGESLEEIIAAYAVHLLTHKLLEAAASAISLIDREAEESATLPTEVLGEIVVRSLKEGPRRSLSPTCLSRCRTCARSRARSTASKVSACPAWKRTCGCVRSDASSAPSPPPRTARCSASWTTASSAEMTPRRGCWQSTAAPAGAPGG